LAGYVTSAADGCVPGMLRGYQIARVDVAWSARSASGRDDSRRPAAVSAASGISRTRPVWSLSMAGARRARGVFRGFTPMAQYSGVSDDARKTARGPWLRSERPNWEIY